ncbi:MAG: efflux RND transporter permease subunit [Spirochaetales bacterium]|nr:efflux RND transporter permease subunit [Spirochaetales bacterium]
MENQIANRFRETDEIGLVLISGLRENQIQVELDMSRLAHNNLSVRETASLISSYLIDRTAGEITVSGLKRLVKMESGISSENELKELMIRKSLRVRDIAAVSTIHPYRDSGFFFNGKEAWGLQIYKAPGSSASECSQAVQKIIPSLNERFKGSLRFEITVDESRNTGQSMAFFLLSLFSTVLCIGLTHYVQNRRIIDAVLVVLPVLFSLTAACFILFLCKKSLNRITLTGMIGSTLIIAVNSSVSVYRLRQNLDFRKIQSPLLSGFLCTGVLLVPALLFPGRVPEHYNLLVSTILILMTVSLPAVLFLIPACFHLLNKSDDKTINTNRSTFQQTGGGTPLWRKGLDILFLSIILMTLPFLLRHSPCEPYPLEQNQSLILRTTLPAGRTEAMRLNDIHRITLSLQNEFHLNNVTIESSGSDRNNVRHSEQPESSLQITLNRNKPLSPEEQRTILNYCRRELLLKDCRMEHQPGIRNGNSSTGEPMILTAESPERLYSYKLPPGWMDDSQYKQDVFIFRPENLRLRALGITPAMIQTGLSTMINGVQAGELNRESGSVLIKGALNSRRSLESLRHLTVNTVPLHMLGNLTDAGKETVLSRRNSRYIRKIYPEDSTQSEMSAESLTAQLPPDISLLKETSSDSENTSLIALTCLLITSLILGSRTGSLKKTVFLCTLLFAALWGSVLMLLFTGIRMNIYILPGLLVSQIVIVHTGLFIILFLSEQEKGFPLPVNQIKRLIRGCYSLTIVSLIPFFILSVIRKDSIQGLSLTAAGGLISGYPVLMILLPSFCKNQI